ncbi:MAG: PAS domain-containing sensor histidine kinase [Bdellovibrionota bacterium]
MNPKLKIQPFNLFKDLPFTFWLLCICLLISLYLVLSLDNLETHYLFFLLFGSVITSFSYLNYAKRIEMNLQESERQNATLIDRYHVLTENLASAVIIRGPDGNVLYCSPYTSNLTGYSLDQIYDFEGDFFFSIVHPDDVEAYTNERNYSKLGERFQCRYRIYNQQDFEIWIDSRSVPIFNEEGIVISSLTIAFDVTGAVRREQQIEEKNRDLADFTYMVSHDLKSPIHTIRGMLNIISEDHKDNVSSELQELLDHVGSSSERLETLVASVLEYARVTNESAKLGTVDTNQVIQSVANDFTHMLNEIGGKLEIESNLPEVIGNETQIYQIFSNLVSNAIKYREKTRDLIIQIKNIKAENERELSLAVIDNGQGVPEDQQVKIFRPFQRAHGKEIEGSGIGLACVNKLLEKNSGSISLISTYGEGSSFVVSLKKVN